MKKSLTLLFVLLVSIVLTACSTDVTEKGEENVKVGVSLMTLQFPFFQDIRNGIEQAANEHGIEIVNIHDANLDIQNQVSAIENFVAQGVDYIILNAVDPSGIEAALNTAEERGIPVITVDMRPSAGSFLTFIGSDNSLGGELAGLYAIDFLNKVENGEKSVAILANPLSSASNERVDGFKSKIAEDSSIKIVQEVGRDTREQFMSATEDLLVANPSLNLIFAYSAQGGLGAYDAIEAAGLQNQVAVIGFDATSEEQDLINKDSNYIGSVIQFPEELGVSSIQTILQLVNGSEIPVDIPVEVGFYTKDGILTVDDLDK